MPLNGPWAVPVAWAKRGHDKMSREKEGAEEMKKAANSLVHAHPPTLTSYLTFLEIQSPRPSHLISHPPPVLPKIATMTVDKPLLTTVRYVKRDEKRDATVKPYILHFAAPKDFPQNNFAIEPVHGVEMRNLRTAGLDYNDHGLAIASIDDAGLDPANFDDDDWIEREYLPRLHDAVCRTLGAEEMTVFDWMVRKRAASFPKRAEGEAHADDHQPSLSAHIGLCCALTFPG